MAEADQIAADLALSEEIAARDATIAGLRQQVAQRDQTISDHSDLIAGQAATIEQTRVGLSAAEQKIAALEAAAAAAAAAQADPDAVPVPEGTPKEILLTSPHGFIDAGGVNRFWPAGTRVNKPAEVALLVGRKAEHQVTIAG
jgi:uncharacterized coiled-coil protein SlyX